MNNSTKNTAAQQTPLFQANYKLYVAWHLRCETIPKKDRFTIGQKTENLLLDMLILISTAYHTNNLTRKQEILRQANISLECLKIIIRLAKDIKTIEQKYYIEYQGRLQEIGKMLGGWINSLHKTNR